MAKQQEQNFTNTELYPDQLGKLYSFKEEKARYRKSYINWDKIKRANKKINPIRQKSFFLSDKANKLLSIIVAKLQKSERVLLNHKYISTFTIVERRQNVRIIEELAHILDITYHNSITHNDKKYRYSYEFSYKEQNLENITCVENSVGTFMSQQNDLLYIYKENKNIENIDLESNFLQNSESSICPKKTTRIKKRLPNERKKPTNAELKARIYHFNQYKKPQDLKHHYPLTKEDGDKLQSLSGRDFSLNAMNEILLDMSKRLDNLFCSKAQFMAYFGKCLRFEIRDAVKTGNDNFRIKANITVNNNISCQKEQQKMTKSLQSLPEGIWGDICWKLIDIYDEYVYRNWFSKLIPVIDEQVKTIELKTQDSFTKQWIETNYGDVILKVTKSLGLNLLTNK